MTSKCIILRLPANDRLRTVRRSSKDGYEPSAGVQKTRFNPGIFSVFAMLALLGSILVIHLFALMSPGPDFVFVTRTAVVESRARALLGVAGIVAGQIVWSGLSLLGLDILFQQFAGLQKIIAFAGGCYLLWMAFGILRSVWRTRAAKSSTVSADAPARADDEGGVKHPFLYGLFEVDRCERQPARFSS